MEKTTRGVIPTFQTHNDKKVNTCGTSYYGTIYNVPYDYLCAKFGCPHKSDDYKSEAEWDIEVGDGTVFTIYNWKNGKKYGGVNGLKVEEITEWNIGTSRAVNLEHILSHLLPPKTKLGTWENGELVNKELNLTF